MASVRRHEQRARAANTEGTDKARDRRLQIQPRIERKRHVFDADGDAVGNQLSAHGMNCAPQPAPVQVCAKASPIGERCIYSSGMLQRDVIAKDPR